MSISAGELNNFVTLMEKTEEEDEYGQTQTTYIDKVNVWARIRNLRGEEYWEARAAESEVTGEIKIRYRDDINKDMRVKYQGREFDVEAFFDPYEERKELTLLVKERL